jgi:4-amino-4-deoxy-L-arabinose transferase-like glycosyltransferase
MSATKTAIIEPLLMQKPSEVSFLPRWLTLRLILWLATGSRLGTLALLHNFSHPHFFEFGDIARNYLAGKGFSYFAVQGVNVPTAFMPPAYSWILIAFFKIFGDRPATYVLLQVLQVAAGVLLVFLVYRFTLVVWERDTAIVAALITALYPPFLYMPTEMHSINFYMLLTLAPLWCLYVFASDNSQTRLLVGAGLLFGVLNYFRAEAVALPFLCTVPLILKNSRNWRRVIIVVVLPLLISLPWAVRNYRTLGKFTPTTTAGGLSLWYGHNLQATGTQREMWPSGMVIQPDASLQKEIDALPPTADYEVALSALYREEATKFVRSNRQREIELLGRKFFYFWTVDWNHPKARHPVFILPSLIMVMFFAAGLAANRKRLLDQNLLSLLVVFYANFVALVLFVLPRYRLAVEPLMIPFAANGILQLLTWRANRQAEARACLITDTAA